MPQKHETRDASPIRSDGPTYVYSVHIWTTDGGDIDLGTFVSQLEGINCAEQWMQKHHPELWTRISEVLWTREGDHISVRKDRVWKSVTELDAYEIESRKQITAAIKQMM